MRKAAKFFSGPALCLAGTLHFLKPAMYEKIMPDYLPAHRELVYASGVTELASGLGSMHPATRRAAGWLGIATMVGVFPAHIHMLQHADDRYKDIPKPALWGRLPIQGLFIYFLWRACLSDEAAGDPAGVV